MDNKNQSQQIQIEISPEMAKGVYSNFAMISHSHAEFILDLMSNLPGVGKPQVVSRIVLAPEHAKSLAMALQENVMRYEQEFGRIQLGTQPHQIQQNTPSAGNGTADPFGANKS